MVYVTVKEERTDLLHLSRGPGIRSWSIFVGILSVGLGAAFYSSDYFMWKFVYLSCTMFIALSTLDDWEDCVFDKSQQEVYCSTCTILYKLFRTRRSYKKVSVELEDIVDVVVETEVVRYGTTAFLVVLKFASGFSVGVTATATSGSSTEHQLIADKIRSFLELEKKVKRGRDVYEEEEAESTSDDLEDDSSHHSDHTSSAHSDESFEKIDRSELRNSTDTSDEENMATEQEITVGKAEKTVVESEIMAHEPENKTSELEKTAAGNVTSEPENMAEKSESTATEGIAGEPKNTDAEDVAGEPKNTAAEDVAGEPKNTADDAGKSATEPENTVTEAKN